MTLHIEELSEMQIKEMKSMANKYGICYFAFDSCYGARDPEIFERACSRAFKSCSNLQNNNPITQTQNIAKLPNGSVTSI